MRRQPEKSSPAWCRRPRRRWIAALPSAGRTALSSLSFRLRRHFAKLLHLLEAGGVVAHDRGDPFDPSIVSLDHRYRELDGDSLALLVQRGDAEEIALAVTASAGFHRLVVAGPVSLAQALRDDDVE